MASNLGLHLAYAEDAVQSARVAMRVFYPTSAPERTARLEAYEMAFAPEAEPAGVDLPLVLVSHGTGGSPLVYRELAAYLARAGFVVALLEHPGNHRRDNALGGTAANLENRPRHLRLAIAALFADVVLGEEPRAGRRRRDRALARGIHGARGRGRTSRRAPARNARRKGASRRRRPWPARPRARPPCSRHGMVLDGGALPVVDVPIFMRTAERDEHTPAFHAEIVLRGVRDRAQIDHRVVPNAGHFAFLTPFPPAITRPGFPPSQDPPGFDRRAYQAVLYPEILSFLGG